MQMRHGSFIIFVIDWAQVEVGFEGAKSRFNLPYGAINVPDYYLILYGRLAGA